MINELNNKKNKNLIPSPNVFEVATTAPKGSSFVFPPKLCLVRTT